MMLRQLLRWRRWTTTVIWIASSSGGGDRGLTELRKVAVIADGNGRGRRLQKGMDQGTLLHLRLPPDGGVAAGKAEVELPVDH